MYQRLIQLFAATGERHLALQQFELCSSILEAELGISPLPETWGMYRAILESQRQLPKPSPTERLFTFPGADVGLLDREEELSKMDEAFHRVDSGVSQVLLISGEAGIGKSRLMQEFARSKKEQACLVFGAARSGEQSLPYQVILDPIRAILGLSMHGKRSQSEIKAEVSPLTLLIEPVWLSEVSRLLPELQIHYPDLPPPFPLEPEIANARLFESLCRLFLAYASNQGPLLFCLDDLHWTDLLTQAWLVHVAREIEDRRLPVLMIGTYRSEEAGAILDLRNNLAQAGKLIEIQLPGLKPAAILAIQRSFLGQIPGEEYLAAFLHQATGGNSFFLIEIFRQLLIEGNIEAYLDCPVQFHLPRSVQESVQARLDHLSPSARQVLEAGAVLGSPFGADLLRLASGRSHAEVLSALEELVLRKFLVETPIGFQFAHGLTRQYVEANLGPIRGPLLHRRAGRAIDFYHSVQASTGIPDPLL